MTLKMQKLADEFLIYGNASEAARRAGYSRQVRTDHDSQGPAESGCQRVS